jgi:hypothetical protein
MSKPVDREWYARELARVGDEIDAREEELRETNKEKRGQIAKLKKRERELRDVISGRRGIQLDIPAGGTLAVLSEARGVRERKEGDE